jgi:arsenate reductase
MAEAILNRMAGDRFEAMSAGLEPGRLNPNAVKVMGEIGLDISRNRTKDVFTLYREGVLFSHVISVCDEANAERCPTFPGQARRISWSIEDPSALTGTDEEKLEATRRIRDQICGQIEEWLEWIEAD